MVKDNTTNFNNVIAKILNFFNLKVDDNQKWILMSLFISGLLCTYAAPQFTKVVITALPAEWLAFESLFGALAGLLIGMMWKGKIRKAAIKYFIGFAVTESALGCLLAMYLCFINFNVWIMAITTLIYSSFISIFVSKCVMMFKSKLWNESGREIYDNNSSIISSIVCIVGYACALFFMPSLEVSLFLWGIACIIDDIGWIIVYQKNKNVLQIN